MEKEFVPYELAVKLKELGFDNLCVFLYYNNGNNYVIAEPLIKNSDLSGYEEITAPTFSQAFRFFREKYDISSYVDYYENDDYERIWYFIIKTKKGIVNKLELLKLVISLREVNEFHEFCAEKLFTEIMSNPNVDACSVMLLYARRGSLDICPVRASNSVLLNAVLNNSTMYSQKAMGQ